MLSFPSLRAAVLPRRTAVGGLLAAGAATVAGCTPRGIDRRRRPKPSGSPTPDEDPDVTLAATVLREEQRVLDVVLATLQRHPELAATLSGARTTHQAHVALLNDAVPREDRPSGDTSPEATSPSATPSGTPSATAVPRKARAAVVAVAREEDRLSLLDRRSAFAAESGAFARVLGSMAAAAAQQAVALQAAGREGR